MPRRRACSSLVAATAVAAGLVMGGTGVAHATTDPLEPINRAVFAFNTAVADYVVAPLASLGSAWLPGGVRRAAANVYANLSEPEFVVSNLLQGNFADAGIGAQRIVVNTTIGLGGIFDPATSLGLVSRPAEFSEVVCRLGVPPGAYLQIPLLGPSNVNSSAVVTGLVVGHVYALSLVSASLAAAEMAVDGVVGAALLRHAVDRADAGDNSPYVAQRREYFAAIANGCAAPDAAPASPTPRPTSDVMS